MKRKNTARISIGYLPNSTNEKISIRTNFRHYNSKYRLVKITDIDEHGNISNKDKKYVDLAKELSADKFLSKGDIVVSRQAFPARAGIFEGEKGVLSSNLVKIKFNEKILLPKHF